MSTEPNLPEVTAPVMPPDKEIRVKERLGIPTKPWADLPPFNLEAALAGKPYYGVWGYEKARINGKQCLPEHDCRVICEPHSGVMIWAGEWLVYYDGTGTDSVEEMQEHFRMAGGAL